MSRPTEHGGGQPGPAIAGDPSSFPNDAELARTMVAANRLATLSTLTTEGFPYGSVVSYANDAAGAPVILVSEMAEHTVNARADQRASMLIVDLDGGGDPLGRPRLTLVGHLRVVEDPSSIRSIYLERHPHASYYVDFADFAFWRLEIQRCRYIGGFGHMSWVSLDSYGKAVVDPLADVATEVVAHMNDDHADANLLYAQVLAHLPEATSAEMTGIDRYGVTLRVDTPDAPRLARVPFPQPLASAAQARPAVVALLGQARGA